MPEYRPGQSARKGGKNRFGPGGEDEPIQLKTPASVEVVVDGERINYDIQRVELQQHIDDHHLLQIRLRKLGQEAADREFADELPYTDFLGKSISLTIKPEGGTIDAAKELGFIGVVTRIDMQNSIDGLNTALITAHSPTISLDGGPRNNFYHDQSSSDIVGSIVRSYPITVGDIESTSGTNSFIVQYRETDWDFARRMATGAGLFAFYDGREFRAVKAGAADEEDLVWRESLGAFSLSLGTGSMNFASIVYNYEQKKTFDQDSRSLNPDQSLSQLSQTSPDASEQIFDKSSYTPYPLSATDARSVDDTLKVLKSRALGKMIHGRGVSIMPTVAVGHVVKVSGMNRFDAQYFVTRVTHLLDKSGQYNNKFECVPLDTAYPDIISHRRQETSLQSAVVTDNQDPDKLGRVKVKFFWHDDDTPWLRIAAPGAGGDRGQYWIPEIGDEVLVGFERDAPEVPVIIGSLFNKEDKPPGNAYDDDNYVKMIKTKGGNVILFNDESGKEKIEIITKSNSLTLSEDGPAVSIKTSGALSFECDQSFSLKAKDVKIETSAGLQIKDGANIKIEAGANLDLKAGAQANLEGAMTNVKGSLVKIN